MIGSVVSSTSGLGTTQTEKTKTTIAPAMFATPMARNRSRVRRATALPDFAACGPIHTSGARRILHARRSGCRRTSIGGGIFPQ